MIKDAGFTTKQWQLGIISMEKHQFLENELDNEDGLEDVTDDIFNFCDQMCKDDTLSKNCLVSQDNFDLAETMNGFELMDPKMDCKAKQDNCFSPQKAKEAGHIKEEWSNAEVLAILNTYLIQEARWLKGNSTLSTIYSFQLLADPSLFESNKIINAYIQYILFFEYEVVELIRSCNSVRDDEFSFPPLHEPKYSVNCLEELIRLLEEIAQDVISESPEGDEIAQAISNHLQLRINVITAFMLITHGPDVMKTLEEQLEEEKEKTEQSQGKKKNKKNKKKKKNKGQKVIDKWKESERCLEECIQNILPNLSKAYELTLNINASFDLYYLYCLYYVIYNVQQSSCYKFQ